MSAEPFQPDWRLDPPDALAVVLRIALHRRGVACSGLLAGDDAWWRALAEEIIQMMGDGISPMKLVELPRPWDQKQG